MTEGPYFKSNSPERTSLIESGLTGTKLVLTGYVLGTDCKPIAHALLDFWQADGKGQYDNAGYMLRGHQFTDEAGRYHLETIVPGPYPGRTEHIHVKVQSPKGTVLTTQILISRSGAQPDRQHL
jgi:protocatechuate 3,4-dioxygenase beta subunit